ncbi:MAG: M20/M25/M40 family metallo-hydrolase [Phycisphaerales bacterium]|nr:M20/M25/M40 family metallo-hydrolase [Phycisphaerales bacterium]
MDQDAKRFLFDLLGTPSPTGVECPVQILMMRELAAYADTVEHDLYGNVMFGLFGGEGGSGPDPSLPTVMIEAHSDQVGFQVNRISEEGYIYVEYLGGIDEVVLPGARVVFVPRRRDDGMEPPAAMEPNDTSLVKGVICKKATHLQKSDEKNKVPSQDEIWIDIGTTSKEETERLVRPGDVATFEVAHRAFELENRRVTSPGLDDKAGLWCIARAFKLLASDRSRLNCNFWAVSSVQEEVGLRGVEPAAYRINPDVALAVDVVNATDDPAQGGSGKEAAAGPCVLGKGPTISGGPNTNPVVAALLRKAAGGSHGEEELKYQQLQTSELEGNDSKAMQTTRTGVAVASVGIPNRAMHTQAEVCDLADMEDTAELLVRFVRLVGPEVDFRPLRLERDALGHGRRTGRRSGGDDSRGATPGRQEENGRGDGSAGNGRSGNGQQRPRRNGERTAKSGKSNGSGG